MADLNYSVAVSTTQAQASLRKLQNSTKQVGDSLQGLQTIIGSIAIGALVRNVLLSSDAMVNMARATDISVAAITAFSQAMSTSGGTADRARDAISDLTKNLGAAAAGSSELQTAFAQVGVSLNDMRNLSTQEIFEKAVSGLRDIPDSATRSTVAMRLFGESVKGVDLDALNNSFNANKADAQENASAITAAAEAQTKLTETANKLNLALISVLEPVNKIVAALDISQKTIESVIKILLSLGGAFLIFRKVLPAIQGATNGFYGLAAAAGGPALKQVGALGGSLKRMVTHLANVVTNGGQAGSRIASLGLAFGQAFKFAARFAGIAGVIYAVAEGVNALVRSFTGFDAIDALTTKIGQGWDWVKGKLGIAKEEVAEVNEKVEETNNATRKVVEQTEKQKEAVRQVKDASIELLKATNETVAGYQKQNEALIETLKTERDRIGLKGEEVKRLETISNFQKQHQEQVQALKDKIVDAGTATIAQAKNNELIKQKIEELNQKYGEQLPIVESLSAEIKAKTLAIEAAAEAAAKEAEKMKEVAAAVERATESAKSFSEKMADATRDAQNDLAMLNMGTLEKEIFKIKTGISKDVANEVRKLQALIAKTGDPDGKIQEQINNIKNAGAQAIQAQSELATKSYEYQRSWSHGWSKAFRDYQEDATNASRRAEAVFSKTTKGMEDAIVGFAKTGKFEWKGFVSSILEELLRAQVQQLIAQIFGAASPTSLFGGTGSSSGGGSSGGGLGSIVSGIGNMFGGSSSPKSSGSSSSGLGSIVSSIGNLFTGNSSSSSSGGGFLDSIGSGISSAVSGVGKFFSGFFANGGMIPAGGYGIVGERGPELVSGPANITPFGGSTTINYNINAVDAQSFAALVARDPGLIYAVTEQGRRSMATRR